MSVISILSTKELYEYVCVSNLSVTEEMDIWLHLLDQPAPHWFQEAFLRKYTQQHIIYPKDKFSQIYDLFMRQEKHPLFFTVILDTISASNMLNKKQTLFLYHKYLQYLNWNFVNSPYLNEHQQDACAAYSQFYNHGRIATKYFKEDTLDIISKFNYYQTTNLLKTLPIEDEKSWQIFSAIVNNKNQGSYSYTNENIKALLVTRNIKERCQIIEKLHENYKATHHSNYYYLTKNRSPYDRETGLMSIGEIMTIKNSSEYKIFKLLKRKMFKVHYNTILGEVDIVDNNVKLQILEETKNKTLLSYYLRDYLENTVFSKTELQTLYQKYIATEESEHEKDKIMSLFLIQENIPYHLAVENYLQYHFDETIEKNLWHAVISNAPAQLSHLNFLHIVSNNKDAKLKIIQYLQKNLINNQQHSQTAAKIENSI